jgi:hypothetical protein
VLARLHGGVPAIVQRIALSPACYVRVLVPAGSVELTSNATTDTLAWDVTSLGVRGTSAQVSDAVDAAKAALAGAKVQSVDGADASDPERRLELAFQALLGTEPPKEPPALGPALVVVSGDVDIGKTLNLLESAFGDMKPSAPLHTPKLKLKQEELRVRLEHPIAQAWLGFVVPAPAPSDRDALAWRLMLYVLTHGYEGRLGKEAIARRGLVYYIDGRYRSDGERAFVSLSMGVDPTKLDAMEALLRDEIARIAREPPTEEELEEAKRNMLGRLRSAAESNEEISAKLALQWLWYGRLLEPDEIEKSLAAITARDLAKIAPAFGEGAFATVSN